MLSSTSFDRAQLKESNGAILFAVMSSAHASSPLPRREGPELPLLRPTLATTHPQLVLWWRQGTWYNISRSEGILGDHMMWGSHTGSTPALPCGLRLTEEHQNLD
jgi:hypothetical protein